VVPWFFTRTRSSLGDSLVADIGELFNQTRSAVAEFLELSLWDPYQGRREILESQNVVRGSWFAYRFNNHFYFAFPSLLKGLATFVVLAAFIVSARSRPIAR
jgi:hypothetical protein